MGRKVIHMSVKGLSGDSSSTGGWLWSIFFQSAWFCVQYYGFLGCSWKKNSTQTLSPKYSYFLSA